MSLGVRLSKSRMLSSRMSGEPSRGRVAMNWRFMETKSDRCLSGSVKPVSKSSPRISYSCSVDRNRGLLSVDTGGSGGEGRDDFGRYAASCHNESQGG